MTEQQLISKLQALKQIKPRQEWAVFTKTEILNSHNALPVVSGKSWKLSNFLGIFSQRRLAYALASFLILFAGVAGFIKYGLPQDNAQKSTTTLVASNTLQNNVEAFKVTSQSLNQMVHSSPEDVAFAVKKAKDATQTLTNTIKENPSLAKTIALDVNNNKPLLDIPGGSDLKASSDDLYKTIDSQMISDFEKTTLTQDQQDSLTNIKKLYQEGDYSDALVNILLLGNTTSK